LELHSSIIIVKLELIVQESNFEILVVDDEELIVNSLGKFLERKGFGVTLESSGNRALEAIRTKKFDLVLADVRMPDGDGIYLLEQLKMIPDCPKLMFITGYSDLSNEELIEKGALHVFPKPIDRQKILLKLKEHFQISL